MSRLDDLYDLLIPVQRRFINLPPGDLVTIIEYWYHEAPETTLNVQKLIEEHSAPRGAKLSNAVKILEESERHARPSPDYGKLVWVILMSIGFVPRVAVPAGDVSGLPAAVAGTTPLLGSTLRRTGVNNPTSFQMFYLENAFRKAKTVHATMLHRNNGRFPGGTEKLLMMQTRAFQSAWSSACLAHLQLWETLFGGKDVPFAPEWALLRSRALRGITTQIEEAQVNALETEAMHRSQQAILDTYESRITTVQSELQVALANLAEARQSNEESVRELKDVEHRLRDCLLGKGKLPPLPPRDRGSMAVQVAGATEDIVDVERTLSTESRHTATASATVAGSLLSLVKTNEQAIAAAKSAVQQYVEEVESGKTVETTPSPVESGSLTTQLRNALKGRRRWVVSIEEEGEGEEWMDEESALRAYRTAEAQMLYTKPPVQRRRRRNRRGKRAGK